MPLAGQRQAAGEAMMTSRAGFKFVCNFFNYDKKKLHKMYKKIRD
jgi:hypothetical protein